MRLVHRDHADPDPAQHGDGGGVGQPFGGDIQQFNAPGLKPRPNRLGFFISIARCQRPRLDPRLAQAAHLIAHQGDQGGNHHSHPGATQRRQLETQGFATTCRHDGQRIAPGQHRVNDIFLPRAKAVKTKDVAQQGGGLHRAVTCSGRGGAGIHRPTTA